MRQRNVTGSPLVLPTLDPPVSVPPGGEIDHPVLLAGFEPVAEPEPEKPASKSTKTASKATLPAAPTAEEE